MVGVHTQFEVSIVNIAPKHIESEEELFAVKENVGAMSKKIQNLLEEKFCNGNDFCLVDLQLIEYLEPEDLVEVTV